MEKRHQVGLKSYDRLFPSQDTLPKGGFGNLIALPLQKIPRDKGNSVFLDSEFQPFPDQWAYLSSINRLDPKEVEKLVVEAINKGSILCIKSSTFESDTDEDPWTLPPSGIQTPPAIDYPIPQKVAVVLGDLLYFEKASLPARLQSQLIRLAAFQNPEFYKAQAMRRSTNNLSRILFCSEEFPKHIGLPRGCLPDVENLHKSLGVEIELNDERLKGKPLRVGFKGKLRPQQKFAVKELCKHDIGILSFEQLMKKVKAHYVLGLTATPVRKDGHHPIIIMQCGPIRYRYSGKEATADSSFNHVVRVRSTGFQNVLENNESALYEIYQKLIVSKTRNDLICQDILDSLKDNRSPLLLTERTEHLDILNNLLMSRVKNVVILKGGMGKKQRDSVEEQLKNIGKDEERVILATGRYIGEGFDDPRLGTLFLALPISWKGTIQQYAGRLHRQYDGKKEVRIYDYLDESVPMLARMYQKRLRGYNSIGYSITGPENTITDSP